MDGTILLGVALAAAAVDQASKLLVVRRLAVGRQHALAGCGVRRVDNARGSLFGLSVTAAVAAWLVVVVCLVLLVALTSQPPGGAAGAAGLGLALGGATSNLADRLTRGSVIDFIALGRWPVFNLADAGLVAGVALAGWSVL